MQNNDDNIEEQKIKNCIRAKNFRLRNKDNDELDFINIVHHLGKAITESINHISKSMEHNNMMDYTLVPVAASLLNAYATQFLNLELSALEAKEELANLIDDLK